MLGISIAIKDGLIYMAIFFADASRVVGYDINYVKDVYTKKQEQGTTLMAAIKTDEEVPADSIVVSRAYGTSDNYFAAFAKDYIEGRITGDELCSHMEDLYYGRGMYAEDAKQGAKQYHYNEITMCVYMGVLGYYTKMNAAEWSENAKGAQFYYNSDYHYQHLEQIPSLFNEFEAFAERVGVESELGRFNKNICTVNGRMSSILSAGRGVVASWDEIPPPGFKMTLYTKYQYSAKIEVDNNEYVTNIPFSFDDLAYKFSLAELLLDYNIPEKYMAYIRNISVVSEAIAHLYIGSGGKEKTHGISSEIFAKIKDFDYLAGRAIAAYDANATENVVSENIISLFERRAKLGME
jgi:hypothetical protein